MSRTRLSKISMTPQGTWDSTTEYKRLDVVSNAGASWLAKQDNVGVTPVEGENWQCLFPAKKFELIETIEFTEDTGSVVRTTEPDGTAYKFTDLMIYHQFPTSKSGSTINNFGHTIWTNSNGRVDIFRGKHTLNQYSNPLYVAYYNDYGFYSGYMSSVTTNPGYLDAYPDTRSSSHGFGDYIKKLIFFTTGLTEIYAGTVTKIYAVRA